ncbi:hypothetical protein BDW74DRAFT_110111 [Aspergillus multicolor]|uniref:uncharacterized protein n=1 Tax=Aspergillus multicolor TaxID=41759 RepID=UPI003CCD4546
MPSEETKGKLLHQIQNTIDEFLRKKDIPRQFRLVGDTPTAILDSTDYLSSGLPFVAAVQESMKACSPDSDTEIETRFIALRITSRHSFFVIDVNNTEYDYKTAHEVTTPIPVYVLRLSKRVKIFRNPPNDEQLASILATMHWGHGNDPLPLVDDYTKPVVYHSPRGLCS